MRKALSLLSRRNARGGWVHYGLTARLMSKAADRSMGAETAKQQAEGKRGREMHIDSKRERDREQTAYDMLQLLQSKG